MERRMEGFVRLAGAIALALPFFSLLFISVAISRARWFSWTGSWLSDLGVHRGSEVIFNGGLVVAGVMTIIMAAGIAVFLENGPLFLVGKVAFLASAFSLPLIGVFTEDYGSLHFAVSLSFFLLGMVAILLIGLAMARERKGLGAFLCCLAIAGGFMWAVPWPGAGGALPEAGSIVLISIFGLTMGRMMLSSPKARS